MAKYVAFLRAVNVGGHNKVKMDYLRSLFEEMGFTNVETFIASGNVIFDSKVRSRKALEKKIEDALEKALGFKVAVFVRSNTEFAAIASYEPFKDSVNSEAMLAIGFLSAEPQVKAWEKLLSLKPPADEFHIKGTEFFWLCRTGFGKSKFSGNVLEKILGMQATMRNSTTVKKLAEIIMLRASKVSPPASAAIKKE